MTELDRVFDELRELREQVSDTGATAARIEERLMSFMHAADERARKSSGRVEAVDVRVAKLETWRWLLVGAYGAIPVVWLVVMMLKGGGR